MPPFGFFRVEVDIAITLVVISICWVLSLFQNGQINEGMKEINDQSVDDSCNIPVFLSLVPTVSM